MEMCPVPKNHSRVYDDLRLFSLCRDVDHFAFGHPSREHVEGQHVS